MNKEKPHYTEDEKLKEFRKVKKVNIGEQIRYLTWVDDKNMVSIQTPDGRELSPEELFDFIIGENITDLARTKDLEGKIVDIAIVLGNHTLPVTRERAIKTFELYKRGIVKKIIFTGGVSERDKPKDVMNPKTMEDYKKHSKILTEKFLRSIGVNPEDVISETMSTSLVTTITHGARAMRQFQKLFKDSIRLTWCPATLDLEKFEKMKKILRAQEFDQETFRKELKSIYCSEPELIKKLMEETANHRNAFILGDIDEPEITVRNKEEIEEH